MEEFKTTRREFAKLLVGSACVELPAYADELSAHPSGQREIVSLDGEWNIEDGIEPESIPVNFGHTVAVPGLAHLATPPFPDVDQYSTREHILTMIGFGLLPPSADTGALGQTPQKRNYFWYQKSFRVPAKKPVAILVINKAQFGTAVWLNGRKIGEHLGCFTRGHFNLTDAIDWEGENHLLVRIGAHPGALPTWVPAGTDREKAVWTPGVYDSVSLHLCDSPVIEAVQVAPQIRTSSVTVQTKLHNYGPETTVDLVQRVKTWKGARPAGKALIQHVRLARNEVKTLTQTMAVPDAVRWSPEAPFLYVLETRTEGDNVSTRFGMREFHFETVSRRAFLNGRPYFLRGATLTLHRFFGDPLSKGHPWEEAWVRKVLGEIPKRMHWNSFRICIGPAPEMWLDIADEVGLLLHYEYAMWCDYDWRQELWKTEELVDEYKEFVQDNWNHPSVAIWGASNETLFDTLREKVIPAARALDLSNRPWDNAFCVPQAPDDCIDDHPYLFPIWYIIGLNEPPPYFDMTILERMDGPSHRSGTPSGHAAIINEYDSLFLRRDGTPTIWNRRIYDYLVGPDAPAEKRFAVRAYLLAGLTEFWRALPPLCRRAVHCLPGRRPVEVDLHLRQLPGHRKTGAATLLRGVRGAIIQAFGRVYQLLAGQTRGRPSRALPCAGVERRVRDGARTPHPGLLSRQRKTRGGGRRSGV